MSEEDFRNILRAWHNNNGIQGFADYFEWGGYSAVYHHHANQTGESVKSLILKDYYKYNKLYTNFESSLLFRDSYLDEWWYVWKTHSLNEVYFRSDGSIYHWLMSIMSEEKKYRNGQYDAYWEKLHDEHPERFDENGIYHPPNDTEHGQQRKDSEEE